jgi:hypothetical protein
MPLMADYLAALPRGLDSYPECTAAASMATFNKKARKVIIPGDWVPPPIADMLTRRLLDTEWVPEVHYHAMALAIADHHGLDAAGFRGFWYDVMRLMMSSAPYGFLLRLLSSEHLVRASAARWRKFHRGPFDLEVRRDEDVPRVILTFPPYLINEALANGYEGVFAAYGAASRARGGRSERVAFTPKRLELRVLQG